LLSYTAVVVVVMNNSGQRTYLTSLFALSSIVTPKPLNRCFDYGLGCLRQVYQPDGSTGMTLAGP